MNLLQNILESMRAFPNLLQCVGILGFLIYMTGFALVQSEKICGNGIAYPASKVFAATCVLISLVGAFNLASFLIQFSYIMIGLYGIVVRRMKPRPDWLGAQRLSPVHQAGHDRCAVPAENIVILPNTSSQPPTEQELGGAESDPNSSALSASF